MKNILFTFLVLTSVECTTDTTVYTCNSPSAKKYHLKENCRGLSNCNYRIIKTTLTKARQENKTLCKWEETAVRK